MNRPNTAMAPALKPEDQTKEYFYGLDAESIRKGLLTHLEFTLAELPKHVDSEWEPYLSLALTVRDRLIERWSRTQDAYYANDAKRIYYMSLEFLMGRALTNSLITWALAARLRRPSTNSVTISKNSVKRSGMRVSAMAVLDDSLHAYWTRSPPGNCPRTGTVSDTNTASSISASPTDIKWRFPMPGCATATPGRFPALTIFSA